MNSFIKKKSTEKSSLVDASYGWPTEGNAMIRQSQLDELKSFLSTAPNQWNSSDSIKRFDLPNGESISCVLWDQLFFISGTDIVRSLTFRFYAFGRPVTNPKKFEEGVFSDLRNLKPGHDSRLEDPKSDLLDMLYKNNCIRTQKKQKVFFWFSVPHDRLFFDALERDLKREKMGFETTTTFVASPASPLDLTQEMIHTLSLVKGPMPNSSLSLTQAKAPSSHTIKRSRVNSVPAHVGQQQQVQMIGHRHHRMSHHSPTRIGSIKKSTVESPIKTQDSLSCAVRKLKISTAQKVTCSQSLDFKKQKALMGSLNLFDGKTLHKQRRRRIISSSQSSPTGDRVRTHENCHHPAPVSVNFSRVPSFGSPPTKKPCHDNKKQSRLAMAAYKAGLVQPAVQWNEASANYLDETHDIFGIIDDSVEMFCDQGFSEAQQIVEHSNPELFSTPKEEIISKSEDYMNPLMVQPNYSPLFNENHSWDLLDIDFEMQNTTTVNHCAFPFYDQQQYDLPTTCSTDSLNYYSTTGSTNSLQYYEDDFSSSTASSPSDHFNSSMTLFSPFKPIFQEDQDMLFDHYASFADPFSTHMNFAFGA